LKKSEITKKNIHSQKEQEEYLKILDDFIIISRTDLKGKITYVNDIFCEISGYSKEELLNAPHNIVRHPDMPQDAFKKLWDSIKKDNIWTGIVKNKAKNGETYIAKSTILPYYEDEVKTGYLGLRYVITDEITEKSAIKAYLTKTVVKFKTELKEKNDLIKEHLDEIELLKNSNDESYYIGWQRELKKKEKLQEQVNKYEDKIKDIEELYQRRIDKFLLERRENDDVLAKKNNQIRTLTDEKNILNEQIDSFKLDIEEKISHIKELQKRNQDLEDVLTHKEEQLQKLK
jgi:PAS domain S-box-containing protein